MTVCSKECSCGVTFTADNIELLQQEPHLGVYWFNCIRCKSCAVWREETWPFDTKTIRIRASSAQQEKTAHSELSTDNHEDWDDLVVF